MTERVFGPPRGAVMNGRVNKKPRHSRGSLGSLAVMASAIRDQRAPDSRMYSLNGTSLLLPRGVMIA